VAAPLRQFLAQVDCRTQSVIGIDVVIACGRRVNLNAVPGMSDHAFALKTAGDAMQIRSHVIQQLEIADASESAEHRRAALSFIVVGGGFSGVEAAGEINDLVRESRRFYPRIAQEDITVTLVHSGEQILPEVSHTLRDFARRKMEAAGITVVTGARAAAATRDGIWLTDGRQTQARGRGRCPLAGAPARPRRSRHLQHHLVPDARSAAARYAGARRLQPRRERRHDLCAYGLLTTAADDAESLAARAGPGLAAGHLEPPTRR
jgi:hypothetical protein